MEMGSGSHTTGVTRMEWRPVIGGARGFTHDGRCVAQISLQIQPSKVFFVWWAEQPSGEVVQGTADSADAAMQAAEAAVTVVPA